jgi:ubiquinone biosynthesis monooxygenase Coq7
MSQRDLDLTDRILGELDHALRVVAAKPRATRATPGDSAEIDCADPAEVARLMRVNHTGEIAAQALYRGQALVARDADLRAKLLQSADEEHDHLAWCRERAEELGGSVSLLAPLWYAGSFAIGVTAGLAGDAISLGFLAETEQQVTEHLDGHLDRVPDDDYRSRAILEQMRADEVRHGEGAIEDGGTQLPEAASKLMRLTAKLMTSISYRV